MMKIGNNPLRKILDRQTVEKNLQLSRDKNERFFIWKLVNGTKFIQEVKFKYLRKSKEEIIFDITFCSEKSLKKILEGQGKTNIFIPQCGALFQSQVIRWKEDELSLKYPDMMAQVERRKSPRCKVTSEEDCKLLFSVDSSEGSKVFDKKCFDISIGGASFIINNDEAKYFKSLEKIDSIKLQLKKNDFEIEAEIVNLIAVEPSQTNGLAYSGQKVCLQFKDLESFAKLKIEDYVMENIDFSEMAV